MFHFAAPVKLLVHHLAGTVTIFEAEGLVFCGTTNISFFSVVGVERKNILLMKPLILHVSEFTISIVFYSVFFFLSPL